MGVLLSLRDWFLSIVNQLATLVYESSVDSIIAGLGLLVVINFLVLKQHYVDKFPPSLYIAIVLSGLILFDLLTPMREFLWGYLLIQGIVVIRLYGARTVLAAFSFYIVYLFMHKLEQVINLREIGEGLLFVLIGWMGFLIYKNQAKIAQSTEENRQLVAKVDEAQLRLREYIDELEETSRRDYLTGLYNISGFQEQVTKSLARCEGGHSYHVICIELVNFEKVVMHEGVDEGDRLLINLAYQLKQELPPYGQVTRYDGNKFAVGLIGDESTLKNCMEIMESVVGEVDAAQTQINCCIAHATYPVDASSASELIRLAEQRLSMEQRQLRRMEEEHTRHLEKLSAVGQLAAGLAHEIRNPLTSIRGFIQISAAESKEVKKWESIILPEIDRINDLLNQFLHLSDSRPTRYTQFRLDQLIHDVVRLLHPKAFLMGYKLVMQKTTSPLVIEADAEQLKQVLINLVQNGLDSLGNKGENGQVNIRWKELRDRVSIRVQDNGNGIQSEHMSRIFDPFFSTKGDGTGMGLYICHSIVAEHGGKIHVTSDPNLGTTFNIHLPLRQSRAKIIGTSEKNAHKKMETIKEERKLKESV